MSSRINATYRTCAWLCATALASVIAFPLAAAPATAPTNASPQTVIPFCGLDQTTIIFKSGDYHCKSSALWPIGDAIHPLANPVKRVCAGILARQPTFVRTIGAAGAYFGFEGVPQGTCSDIATDGQAYVAVMTGT